MLNPSSFYLLSIYAQKIKKKIRRSSPIKIGKSAEFYINIINSKCAKISKKKMVD